ncbi:hypothetical protein CcI49_10225 [Frankia sp. CcI49]|nr:hypothetical protein CcI49_10225 [Frankia sp. CcI49]
MSIDRDRVNRTWRGWRGPVVTIAINVVLVGAVGCAAVESRAGDSRAATDGTPLPSSPGTAGADRTVDLEQYIYATGHCYTWRQEISKSDVKDVPCEDRHLFEAVDDTDLDKEYSSSAFYPRPEEWPDIIARYCSQMMDEYLGYPLDPYGRFGAGAVYPDSVGWEQGDRSVTCGIVASGTETDSLTAFMPFEGWVPAVGTCFSDDAGHLTETSCAAPHNLQSIGAVTVPGTPPGDGPPSDSWLDEQASQLCADLAAPYLRTDRFDSASLTPQWNPIDPESWRAGTRRTSCYVGFVDENGTSVPVHAAMPVPAA